MCLSGTKHYICMYVCMHVCMYVWMDGWMDGWMVLLIVILTTTIYSLHLDSALIRVHSILHSTFVRSDRSHDSRSVKMRKQTSKYYSHSIGVCRRTLWLIPAMYVK